jgi:hypothetical protein
MLDHVSRRHIVGTAASVKQMAQVLNSAGEFPATSEVKKCVEICGG